METVADAEVDALIGLNRAKDFAAAEGGLKRLISSFHHAVHLSEVERSELLLVVRTDGQRFARERLDVSADAIQAVATLSGWVGKANQLSAEVHKWKEIEEIWLATRKPRLCEQSASSEHSNFVVCCSDCQAC